MLLSPQEFRRALHAGLGRALRDVDRVPQEDRKEILMDACLHNRTIDPQVDSDRAGWLCEVLERSGNLAEFAPRLLEPVPGDTEDWDHLQRIHLVRELGIRGVPRASAILRGEFEPMPGGGTSATIARRRDHLSAVASDLVRVDGLDGFRFASKALEKRVDEQGDLDDSSVCEMLTEEAAERFGWTAVESTLREAASADEGSARFLSAVESRFAPGAAAKPPVSFDPSRQFWGAFTFADVRARVEHPSLRDHRDVVWVSLWGKWVASESDLNEALAAVASEIDPKRAAVWSAAFTMRTMPRLEGRFFELLDHPDSRISWNAVRALEHVGHPDVRRRALDGLRAGRCDGRTLRLLRANFSSEDVPLLARALSTAVDPEEKHDAAFGIRRIAETHGTDGLRGLLEWSYENGVCCLCRENAVGRLVEAGEASRSILEECLFDSSPELRKLSRTTLDSPSTTPGD